MKKRLVLVLPLFLLAVVAGIIIALPSFVASRAHRATIEALAGSLTGREVHIGGKLSLILLPSPQLEAEDISITGGPRESITAKSLTLDVDFASLLQGRLSASSITLQSPVLKFPWPLAGGAAAVAPAPWLTALHAQISNGTVMLGAVRFTQVNADVFTGADSAVSVSGTGMVAGKSLHLSIGLGAVDATGAASLTLDAASAMPAATGHFSGTLNAASEISGHLNFAVSPPGMAPVSGTASLLADGTAMTATALQASQGDASMTGGARLEFAGPALAATLAIANAAAGQFAEFPASVFASIPVHLALTASNTDIGSVTVQSIKTQADFDQNGVRLSGFEAGLTGGTDLTGNAGIDAGSHVTGSAHLTIADLPGLVKTLGFHAALPAGWNQAELNTALAGSVTQPVLAGLTGNAGGEKFSGSISLAHGAGETLRLAGALHFDTLDLAGLPALAENPPAPGSFDLDGEITADAASFGPVRLSHLLLDASYDGTLSVRRLSAAVYGGLAEASFTLAPGGHVSAGQVLLSVPSATPLLALAPGWAALPAAITAGPLSLALRADGPVTALATSAVATMGDTSLTAAPVLNLAAQTAAGPFTLRHPDAIAAFKAFGLNAGLAWPGAGSISLRADILASPQQFGLPDFVLSMGDLTADGKLMMSSGHAISGRIDADTLALPAVSGKTILPWNLLAAASGSVSITANRLWAGGNPVLGALGATVTLAPYSLNIALLRAAVANGNLTGIFTATSAAAAPPSLSLKLDVSGADLSLLNLPGGFPYSVSSGIFDGNAMLTASGYDIATWRATLSGGFSFGGAGGTMNGFSLAGIAPALAETSRAAALRSAMLGGATSFTSLAASGTMDHGNVTIGNAAMQGPAGGATVSGSIDIPDQMLALNIALLPKVTPPLKLSIATLGSWEAPKQIPSLQPGLAWTATPPNQKPNQ